MRTIGQGGEHELEVKKSRFRCALARVDTEAEARAFIAQRRKLLHDARHHCSAFVLGDQGETQRSSDDGEPAGTAGVPMLEVLRRNDLTNTVAVVSRYFGGVLLGAGGLVRAYGGAVAQAIEEVGVLRRVRVRTVSVTVDHPAAGKLENDLRSCGHELAGVDYAERVRFDVHVGDTAIEKFDAWIAEITGGGADTSVGAVDYAELADD